MPTFRFTNVKAGDVLNFDYSATILEADRVTIQEQLISGGITGSFNASGTAFTVESITGDSTIVLTVEKYRTSVPIPTVSGTYTYKGSAHTFIFNNEPSSSIATKSGDTGGTNAGTYTTRFTLVDPDNYQWADGSRDTYKDVTVTIGKVTPTVTAPTKASNMTYNGSSRNLLASAGSTNFGTLQYRVGSSGSWGTSATATDAGDYTLYYRVVGDSNINDVAVTTIGTVNIAMVTPTVTAPTLASGLTYTGSALNLTSAAGSTNFGTLQYSTDNSSWSTTRPTKTTAGTYTVYYKVVGNSNVNSVASKSAGSVTIAKKATTMTLSASSLALNGSTLTGTVTITSDGDGTISVSSSNTSVATASVSNKVVTVSSVNKTSGSATITVSQAAGTNYAATSKTIAVTAKFSPASGLNVGDTFQLGKYQVGSETATAITWRVVHQTSTRSICMPTSILDLRCFDAKEPNNSDYNRKNYGNNKIGQANLIQWLNSSAAAGSWYTAQHTADQAPSNSYESTGTNGYDTKAGFLNLWTADEIALLQDVTLTLVNNTVTDGGGTYTKTVKVWCPTRYEMGLGNEASGVNDGGGFGAFSYFTDNNSRIMKISAACAANNPYSKSQSHTTDTAWYYWLGTPYAGISGNVRYVYTDGSLNFSIAFYGDVGVVPCIALER